MGPILISSPRIRRDKRVTSSVLNTQEKKTSGSLDDPSAKATQSSRKDDIETYLIAPKGITRSGDILI